MINCKLFLLMILVCVSCMLMAADKGDWPMHGYDAARSASTDHKLPKQLSSAWVFDFGAPLMAWPEEIRLQYDAVHMPIIKSGVMYVGLNNLDMLVAIDMKNGKRKWTYSCNAPIRVAPVAYKDSIIFACDDAHLYSVNAQTGALNWKQYMASGMDDRLQIGNGRIISAWPMRGGPVLDGDTLYVGAGIWPFMGVYIHAIDAKSGKIKWSNIESNNRKNTGPHGSNSWGTASPQGYMGIAGGRLIIANGRQRPSKIDLKTHAFEDYYTGYLGSSWQISASESQYFCGAWSHDLESASLGMDLASNAKEPTNTVVIIKDQVYCSSQGRIMAYDLKSYKGKTGHSKDYEHKVLSKTMESKQLGNETADRIWLRAGDALYVSQGTTVKGISLSSGKKFWEQKVDTAIGSMAAGDKKLLVSTVDGKIYCFAGGGGSAGAGTKRGFKFKKGKNNKAAKDILKASAHKTGWCLVLGLEDGSLVESIARNSEMKVVGIDADEEKVLKIRQALQMSGLYGTQIQIICADPSKVQTPQYFAKIITSENMKAAKKILKDGIASSLRPYNGQVILPQAENKMKAYGKLLDCKGVVSKKGKYGVYTRNSGLKGAGTWSAEGASAANTYASDETLLQYPLGILWYGGDVDKEKLYSRHFGATKPMVSSGVMIIEGPQNMFAYDVYTGEVLWRKDLTARNFVNPEVYHYQPFASAAIGGVYVLQEDRVFMRMGDTCTEMDIYSGEVLKTYTTPDKSEWGYLAVHGNYLIGGVGAIHVQGKRPGTDPWSGGSSAALQCIDRTTGKQLWQVDANWGFRHLGCAIGKDTLFVLDRQADQMIKELQRRGKEPSGDKRLLAIDITSGKISWQTNQNVLGAMLSYSEKHGVVIQSNTRDGSTKFPGSYKADEECIGYDAQTGKELWSSTGRNPSEHGILAGDYFYLQWTKLDVKTGASKSFSARRDRGCDRPTATQSLFFFRSSSSAYAELDSRNTYHLSTVRPSCSGSLIPAAGLLNSPKSSAGCICNYANQTSFACVHMPDIAQWNKPQK
ncbi:MAG: PQQ-binding-like beta-propeller repeat protein [Planctomycetes bacterium]|nr:PQQ-binding-like beta-propeller repeat protein [Planctomycetota bacterium]